MCSVGIILPPEQSRDIQIRPEQQNTGTMMELPSAPQPLLCQARSSPGLQLSSALVGYKGQARELSLFSGYTKISMDMDWKLLPDFHYDTQH